MRAPLASIFLVALVAQASENLPVYITRDLPYVDVKVGNHTVRIERHPDTENMIEPDFALTSRPCPPFCIQPLAVAPGVETLGELELIAYLRRLGDHDGDTLLIDCRDGDAPIRTGVIPGAVVIPWTRLFPAETDPELIADVLEDRFGAIRSGPLWSFTRAKTLIFYCNGPWCGQSPTIIKVLLAMGYPPSRLKWYRQGLQGWKGLGLTTVPPAER